MGPLIVKCGYLESDISDCCFVTDHCPNIMQFSFSANRILGDFFNPNRLRESLIQVLRKLGRMAVSLGG